MPHAHMLGPVSYGPGGGARAARGRVLVRRIVWGALAALTLAAAAPPPASATPEPVRWVALGDSYTAGVFVGDPSPPLGSADRDGCDRTTGSYPHLVARALAAAPPAGRPVQLTDASCSGATVQEITTARQTPTSPVQPPESGWPSVAPQTDRAHLNASTDVVTVAAGTNNLPFGPMLFSCLLAGTGQPDATTPCRDAYQSGGTALDPESITDKYDRITREYAAMLRAVHDRAPRAKVITIGYPTVFPEDPSGCGRNDTTELAADISGLLISITHGDIAWLHEVTTHLNLIIQSVTELSGDTYVDTATSSADHDVCRPSGTKWVEGICGQAGDYWPSQLALLGALTLQCPDATRATLIHPNAAGHANTATHVEAAIRAALT